MRKKDKNEIELRNQFLNVYADFNNWLHSLGFRTANTNEMFSVNNYHYNSYNDKIDCLCSVENYIHNVLNYQIHFLRDRNEHKFMFVGTMGSSSEVVTIEEAKQQILSDLIELRDNKLMELNNLKLV